MHASRPLVLALVLTACPSRPAPNDTDTATADAASSTSTTGAPTSTSASTGETTGAQGWHLFGACKPVDGDAACPGATQCCSEDPATVGGLLPNYYHPGLVDGTYSVPLFSSNNNALSYWGWCVDVGEFMSPLVNGCPVPCNPRWSAAEIADICGTEQCCSFTELDPNKDCIVDPGTGRWRAVRGADILDNLTGWGPTHATNQDPFADGCDTFSAGNQDVLLDCIAQLSVADQRGFCYAPGCPCVEDACDMKNPDWVPRCP